MVFPVQMKSSCAEFGHPERSQGAGASRSEDGPAAQRSVSFVSPGQQRHGYCDGRSSINFQEAGDAASGALSGERQHAASNSVLFPANSAAEQSGLLKALLAQQVRSSLPKPEIPKFSGCVTDYIPFIKAFDSVIGSKLDNDEEKLHFLEQFTVGEPRDIVKGCLMLPAADGYRQARARLQRRYGGRTQNGICTGRKAVILAVS